jgi:TrmH family RNA methyltransferase
MATQALRHVVVVLHEPQDPVNIGAVVRAMKNMGLGRLRLVNPGDFDPYRIHGVAHTGMDVIESAEICDRLADAVADARLVLGTTARERRARRNYRRPRDAAAEILAAASEGGEVAVVFGREDCGLTNDDLDRCDRVIVIPTHPDHPSLNLAQAVMIVEYEL